MSHAVFFFFFLVACRSEQICAALFFVCVGLCSGVVARVPALKKGYFPCTVITQEGCRVVMRVLVLAVFVLVHVVLPVRISALID